MAKSRRKKSGCRAGAFKRKRMGKGWAVHRRPRGRPVPVDRSEKDGEVASGGGDGSASS